MALYARITADDDTKIGVHRFGAALREVARGNLSLAQVTATFSLDAGEQTELSAIATTYTDLTTDMDRSLFLGLMEDALILAEIGDYNEATVKSRLGF